MIFFFSMIFFFFFYLHVPDKRSTFKRYFFYCFSAKTYLAGTHLKETICMKYQTAKAHFLRKMRKIFQTITCMKCQSGKIRKISSISQLLNVPIEW